MKLSGLILSVMAVALFSMSSPLSAKQQELPEVTEDGLQRLHDSKMAIVYAKPGASLTGYEKVQLLDAYVAFKKNWERDQRSGSASMMRISSKDIENIKNSLAELFQEEFRTVLEEGGFPVVGEAGPDVLLVRPAIINLDVNAPDIMASGRSKVYTDSAGEMTLYVEIYDSVTGDLIAKAMDRRVDGRHNGFYTWTNSVTNKVAAKQILKGWANILVTALNEAKQQANDAGAAPENDQ